MLIVTLHNNATGSNQAANYDAEVRMNDRVIYRGAVKGHNRKHGWQTLLVQLATEATPVEGVINSKPVPVPSPR